jgi:hypothetical protein
MFRFHSWRRILDYLTLSHGVSLFSYTTICLKGLRKPTRNFRAQNITQDLQCTEEECSNHYSTTFGVKTFCVFHRLWRSCFMSLFVLRIALIAVKLLNSLTSVHVTVMFRLRKCETIEFRSVGPFSVSRFSSVSIVSGYGLEDREIEFRSPAKAKGFFL